MAGAASSIVHDQFHKFHLTGLPDWGSDGIDGSSTSLAADWMYSDGSSTSLADWGSDGSSASLAGLTGVVMVVPPHWLA
jgi:hypothetical protein